MNKRIILFITIIALASVCAYSQNGKKFYKAGNKFLETSKYEDAVSQYSSAIDLEPSNPVFYIARGRAYEELFRYEDAKADFEKAIVFSPKNVDAHVRLGAVLNKLGRYSDALVKLNHATGLDKRNKAVYPEKVITLKNLEKYELALKASDTALILIKDDPKNYYWRGIIYSKLNNDFSARKEFDKAIAKDKSKRYFEPRLALARILLKGGDSKGAMEQCNEILRIDDRDTAAYLMRSRVYKANIDFPNAINDISNCILIDKDNPDFYMTRGTYYQQFNQHTNAITDFTVYIGYRPNDPKAYFARAESHVAIRAEEDAIDDYKKIAVMAENDPEAWRASSLLKKAQDRLYVLKSEKNEPEIILINPLPNLDSLEIRGTSNNLLISGKIRDESAIKSFTINDEKINLNAKNGTLEFLSEIDVTGVDKIKIVAVDDYDNERSVSYFIKRTEINRPKVFIIAPYASEDNKLFPEKNTQTLFIQGKINDESRIKSIFIDGVSGSYNALERNPSFTAFVDILNKDRITVEAEDIYGNKVSDEYILIREGAIISENNPMGNTWVIFIENSDYENFASLEGPIKDVELMTRALSNYQINQIVTKKNMTKAQMENYFTIELRDLIKANQIKSLLVWYSGHGKIVQDVGHWIPVDAELDKESTYFKLSVLRASMESYQNYLTHTLIVTDACETGPGFYQAMRSAENKKRSCDDWQATQFKSSQVFGSAEKQLAVDDSQFTQTFANTLINNRNACIPIEEVVLKVSSVVSKSSKQKPYFGTISGLRDEEGTFFFISK
jgi:tetratricopeptide (TPR) repeat protein